MCDVMGGQRNVLHWRATTALDCTGAGTITSTNTNRVFVPTTDGAWKSCRPGRSINGFTSVQPAYDMTTLLQDWENGDAYAHRAGKAILIDAIQDYDLGNWSMPISVCDESMAGDLDPTVLADSVTPFVMQMNSALDRVANFGLATGTRNTSTGAGNWTDASKWDQGHIPAAGEVVWVKHAITFDSNATAKYKAVIVCNGGSLNWSLGGNRQLWMQHLLVRETGSMTIGVLAARPAANITCKIVITNSALDINVGTPASSFDANQWGNGLVGLGTIQMFGFDRGSRIIRTAGELTAGATTITLSAAATNWQVGDRIVIPDSRQYTTGVLFDHVEVRTIASFSSGNTVVHLSSALTYDHPGARDDDGTLRTDMLPHVVNLTSNVIIQSEDATGVPGHTVFMDRCDPDLDHVAFFEMGRTTSANLGNATWSGTTCTANATNQVGKYAVHFHHQGGRTTPVNGAGYQWRMRHCVIDGGDNLAHVRKAGYTIHGTHHGLLQGCVGYNLFGGGIVLEDGSETNNLIDGNCIIYTRGNTQREDADNVDAGFFRNGGGLWCRSGQSFITNNIFANCFYGFILNGITGDGNYQTWIPTYPGAMMPGMGTVNARLWTLGNKLNKDNEVYACGGGGTAWSWNALAQYFVWNSPRFVLDGWKCWHCQATAFYFYEQTHATIQNWTVRGDMAASGTSSYAWAFRADDYSSKGLWVRDCTVHGMNAGIMVSPALSDYMLIDDCVIHCGIGILCESPGAPGGGGNGARGMHPRVVISRNNDLTPTVHAFGGTDGISSKYEVAVLMHWTNSYNRACPMDMFLYGRNGDSAQNWQLYFPEQDPADIMELSTDILISCPEAGLTNQQAHDKYVPWTAAYTGSTIPPKSDAPNPATPGLATCGELMPAGTTAAAWTSARLRAL